MLLAGLVLAFTLALINWITGADCRSRIERKTAEVLHAKAELAPLHWIWFGVGTTAFNATGAENAVLKRMEAEGVHAQLKAASLLKGIWGVEEITLEKMTLHLRPGQQLGTAAQGIKTEHAADSATNVSAPAKWIPTLFVIESIRSERAYVFIEFPKGTVELQGTRLEARPEGSETRFEARGGVVKSDLFPDMNLKNLRCRVSGAGLELTGARLTLPAGGDIHFEGFLPSDGGEQKTICRWENIPVAALLPTLGDKVTGTLEGNGKILWKPGEQRKIEGSISARDVTLTEIPFLGKLAAVTGMDQFRHLPVQEAHADFLRDDSLTHWSNVVLESKGYLKLTGEATAGEAGAFDGTFQIGITTAIVNMFPAAKELLGLNEHDGYIWMPLRVGGTLSHPTEDLSSRLGLMAAAGAEGIVRDGLKILGLKIPDQASPASPSNNAQGSTNNPSPRPNADTLDSLRNQGGAVIDTLGGFLK